MIHHFLKNGRLLAVLYTVYNTISELCALTSSDPIISPLMKASYDLIERMYVIVISCRTLQGQGHDLNLGQLFCIYCIHHSSSCNVFHKSFTKIRLKVAMFALICHYHTIYTMVAWTTWPITWMCSKWPSSEVISAHMVVLVCDLMDSHTFKQQGPHLGFQWVNLLVVCIQWITKRWVLWVDINKIYQ